MAFYNLFMLASVVNPLIYVFTNDFYKKAFMEVFGLDGSNQGNLFRGVDNKIIRNREFYFVYIFYFLSKTPFFTQFMWKQNGSKL